MLFNSPIKSPIIIHKIISNLNFLFPALYTFAPIYIYTVLHYMLRQRLVLPPNIANGRLGKTKTTILITDI